MYISSPPLNSNGYAGSIIYGINKAQLLATTPANTAPVQHVIIDGNNIATLQPVMTQVRQLWSLS